MEKSDDTILQGDEKLSLGNRLLKDCYSGKIRNYNFRRPEKLTKNQKTNLLEIHRYLVKPFESMLSAQSRSGVSVEIVQAEYMNYEEFISLSHKSKASSYASVNMDPLPGSAFIVIPNNFIYFMVDTAFGGNGEGNIITKELTDIEVSIGEGIIIRFLGIYRAAWRVIADVDLHPRLGILDDDPSYFLEEIQMVLVYKYEIQFLNQRTFMRVCLPVATVDSIRDELDIIRYQTVSYNTSHTIVQDNKYIISSKPGYTISSNFNNGRARRKDLKKILNSGILLQEAHGL